MVEDAIFDDKAHRRVFVPTRLMQKRGPLNCGHEPESTNLLRLACVIGQGLGRARWVGWGPNSAEAPNAEAFLDCDIIEHQVCVRAMFPTILT